MKKISKIMLALVFALIPCLMLFSSCSLNVKTVVVRYNLNGGNFTEEYKTENNISSKNVAKVANINYYGGFSDGLADERALVAPEGKVFAGWYLDKECTADNYLTSANWTAFAKAIDEDKGDNVIYAKWIDKGTKDIIFEVADDNISFSSSFISKNVLTNSKRVCFNVSASTFESIKDSLPSANDLIVPANKEFNKWKVENNGHYYDFKTKSYDKNATNKINAHVNSEFDSVKFTEFFAEGNEDVAYVLLRPDLKDKPNIRVNFSLGDKGIFDTELFINAPYLYSSNEVKKNERNEIIGYSGATCDIRYDIDFSFINENMPKATDMELNEGVTFDGWKKFKVDGKEYDFTEENWNAQVKAIRPIYDESEYAPRIIDFILSVK